MHGLCSRKVCRENGVDYLLCLCSVYAIVVPGHKITKARTMDKAHAPSVNMVCIQPKDPRRATVAPPAPTTTAPIVPIVPTADLRKLTA
jgi:hypothetical protein